MAKEKEFNKEEGSLIAKTKFEPINSSKKIYIEYKITFRDNGEIESGEIISVKVDGKLVKLIKYCTERFIKK